MNASKHDDRDAPEVKLKTEVKDEKPTSSIIGKRRVNACKVEELDEKILPSKSKKAIIKEEIKDAESH